MIRYLIRNPKAHESTVHDKMEFWCNLCDHQAEWNCQLRKHILLIHVKQGEFRSLTYAAQLTMPVNDVQRKQIPSMHCTSVSRGTITFTINNLIIIIT